MKKVLSFCFPFLLSGVVLGILFFGLSVPSRVSAALFRPSGMMLVDTLDDEQEIDGNCSLREAISAANSNQPVDACPAGSLVTDTIIFDVEGIVTLTGQLSVTAGGPLIIDGGGVITTSGGGTTRVWWVEADSDLTMQNLAVTGGYVYNQDGAGLYNHAGSLTISQCDFMNNHMNLSGFTQYYGGGVYSEGGNLVVLRSNFFENGSDDWYGHGGGIAAVDATGQIAGTTFQNNRGDGCRGDPPCTNPGGGAVYLENSLYSIQDSTFISNTSRGVGGIFNSMGTVTISGCTFSGNDGEMGGGIWNYGTMIISNSTFIDHHTTQAGAAIYNASSMVITNSIFSGNSSYRGGAISNGSVMTITNSTFSGNSSATDGGAISNRREISINGCTFADNSAQAYGGALENYPLLPTIPPIFLPITNSTFTGNSAGKYGGGIFTVEYFVMLNNSTLSANSATMGGGIYIQPFQGWTTPFTLTNTIVAGSISGGDCAGHNQLVDGGHNLDSDGTCNLDPSNGSLPNTDPMLGTLQDNGGPTWTQALLWGSPAIDAGDNSTCPATDQRGVPRPLDGDGDGLAVCDMGAFELVAPNFDHKFYLPLAIASG